jgi:hypothetical protein
MLTFKSDLQTAKHELDKLRTDGVYQLGCGRIKVEILPSRQEVLWQSPGAIKGAAKPTARQATSTWEALGDTSTW